MRTPRLRMPIFGLVTAAVCSVALIGAGTAAASPTVSVITKGLNNPRYLTFGPGGHLYVAVAGVGMGNPGSCGESGLGTRGVARFCDGNTSAIDEITRSNKVAPFVKILPSIRETDTNQVTGASAVAFHGSDPVVLMGDVQSNAIGMPPLNGGNSSSFGGLAVGRRVSRTDPQISLDAGGAEISNFSASHPQSPATLGGVPGETLYDSNPHDLVPYQGGYAVVDAGANDVLLVNSKFRVSIAARLPTETETAPAGALYPGSPAQTIAAQAVPSSVTVGPDGALYVGVLRGLPGLPGTAEVYRVVPGQAPVAVVTGLTRVSDLAFTRAGNLLILENNTGGALASPTTPGALLSATLNGTSPVTATDLGVSGLVDPVGLTVNSSGDAFITNHASGAHQGEIIKVSGLS